MRTYELRAYTLRTPDALRYYSETVYPRHLKSMPLFEVEAHGFWTEKDGGEPRLFALISYAEGDDPAEVTRRYLASPELAHDVRDFNPEDITCVATTILLPSPGSPLA